MSVLMLLPYFRALPVMISAIFLLLSHSMVLGSVSRPVTALAATDSGEAR